MNAVDLLRKQAEAAFNEVMTALDGVTQGQAWAVLPQGGPDYLHSDATIHGITLHVATAKVIYGSVAFRGSEVRWRDLAEELDTFEPTWTSAMEYFKASHQYWLETWAGVTDVDLEKEVPHFSGKMWPVWKVVNTVTQHESYHAGQIAVLRYAIGESDDPPPSVAEDIRKYCRELPSW